MNEEEGLRILYRRFGGDEFSTRNIEDDDVEVLAELIGFTPSTQHSYARVPGRAGVSNCLLLGSRVMPVPGPDTGITLLSTNSRGAPTPVSPLCTARIRA